MEGIKLLTAAEAEKYISTVDRLKKARDLSPEELKRYQKAYDRMIKYLNENYKAYLVYCVSGGTNKLIKAAMLQCIEHAKKAGLFDQIKGALSAGDSVEFGFQCKVLEILYKYYEHEYKGNKKALNDMLRVG